MRDGRLSLDARDKLLVEMTDEVAALVLRNNYQQTLALSLAQRRGLEDLGFQQRLMQMLEGRGELDRAVEFLPDDAELAERRKRGAGADAAGACGAARLRQALALQRSARLGRAGRSLSRRASLRAISRASSSSVSPTRWRQHRLRREIISTQLTNSMINRGGPAFAVRIADQTGASPAAIAAAFFVVRNSYGMIVLNGAIDALDNKISGKLQLDLYAAVQDLLIDRIVWFVRNVDLSKGLADVVEHYRAGIEAVDGGARPASCRRTPQARAARAHQRADQRRRAGRPRAAHRRACRALAAAPDIVLVADRTGKPIADVAATYFAAGAYLPARPHRERGARHPRHGLFRPARARSCARHDRRGGAAARRRDGRATARPAPRRSRPGSARARATSSASALRCMASPARG